MQRARLEDPEGGLTAAGRKAFAKKDGSHLRPGVRGPADTPEKMKRKGSFLRRHFANPRGPMRDERGEPTRLALSAHAWGERVPTTMADAKRLADKGTKLLDRYAATKTKPSTKARPAMAAKKRTAAAKETAAKKAPAKKATAKRAAAKKSGASAKKSARKAAAKRPAAKRTAAKTSAKPQKNSLVANINKRKRAGTSRPKSRSTVSKDSYDEMEAGWPHKK